MEDISDYIIERLGKLELQVHYIEESLQEDMIFVKRRKLDDSCIYPTQAHEGDSGSDLYSIEDKTLVYGCPTKIKTGLSIQMPKGYRCDIRPRSGLGSKGIDVLGGVIDGPYTGELIVCLINLNYPMCDDRIPAKEEYEFKIAKGEKIAQLVFSKNVQVVWSDAEFEETSRGSSGFGSSGRF